MSTDNGEKCIVSLNLSSVNVVVKVRLESYNGIRKIESDFRLPQFSFFEKLVSHTSSNRREDDVFPTNQVSANPIRS